MINYTLKPYQKVGVKFLLRTPYAILGDAMGLGKTLQAIEVIKRTGLKTLVVCPASLRLTWKSELELFGTGAEDVTIIGYSELTKMESFEGYELIIADEIHYLKNLDAQRTGAFHRLLWESKPERFIGLSGTAIKNRIPEFYSILRLIYSSSTLPTMLRDYWDFCRHFCNVTQFKVRGRMVTKFDGHKNIDELRALLHPRYLRRKASEVLDLPPIVRKDILLEDSEIDHDLLQAWDSNSKAFITYKKNSAKIKAPHTIKYVKDLLEAGEGPVLVYSDHVEPAQRIGEGFNRKYKVGIITGSTPMKERHELVTALQEGKLDVLTATIGALSEGVTLTKARNLVFNDLSFVPGDIAQVEKRIHRIGQTGSCVIHRMFWGKLDLRIGKELDKKIAVLVEVL